MGIFINLKLSKTITQGEWKPVYEKSLLIAQKSGFFDVAARESHSERIQCIVPTQEKGIEKDCGWTVCGSFPTYKRAESQFTPKHLGLNARDSEPYDMLRCKFDEERYIHLWGNKTQGEPYHMGLLAIGCMAEQMLGVQALVDGDITYRQCLKAAETASEMLGKQIAPPVCCRLQNLFDRIQKFDDLTESEKLKLLLEYYRGDTDNELGEFLRNHYSVDALTAYWQEQFKDTEINTYGFTSLMKQYFLLSPDIGRFCRLADFEKDDAEQCELFIKKIMLSSLHIQEKDCSDVLDYTKADAPYGIASLMASFFFHGAHNPAIDRYIPLDEIRCILNEYFGSVANVSEIIDACIASEEEESAHTLLSRKIEEAEKDMDEQYAQYDLCEYEDLIDFSPDSKMQPELIEGIKASFQTYHSYGEKQECTELMEQSADELFHFLVSHFRGYFLGEAHWERIYDELHRDSSAFRRYYPMLWVKITEKISYLVRAFVTDDVFWNYRCENFKEG